MAVEGATQEKTAAEQITIAEKGRTRAGETIYSDRRLFIQLLAYGGCRDTAELAGALEQARVPAALYEDINDPQGIGLLSFHENPDFFLDTLRPLVAEGPFARLQPKPEYTMLGRTYSMGWESDLEEALIMRPRSRVTDPRLRWALWYPLRRSGSFEQLEEKEQRAVLAEHGGVGHSFGKAGLAHDVRLACHGLTKEDNDFIIGVLAESLHPLSAVVQRMRKTRQTSRYLERLGPFFVGRVRWQAGT
ncbi:MAG TPA: chlorite dismutase family protein [Spirochaetia bacterium]|nr:chlorite dismutase family protein [Spirochaetia bacterium]